MKQTQPPTLDDMVAQLIGMRSAANDFDKISQIETLEKLESALVHARAAITADFDRSQREEQLRAKVRSRERGRGIADQIALARRISPAKASRELAFARALRDDLPATAELLAHGRINGSVAHAVHRETDHLDHLQRRAVDAEICAALPDVSPIRAGALAKAAALKIDPEGETARARAAAKKRSVWNRPGKDGMCRFGADLPAAMATAMAATLRRDALGMVSDGSAEGRTLQQVSADLLFERVTGQCPASGPGVEVQIVMTAGQLFGQSPESCHRHHAGAAFGMESELDGAAWLDGYGPIPAAIARAIAAGAPDLLLPSPDQLDSSQAWVRRIFTDPTTGQLTGFDTKRRRFDATVRRFIQLRDRSCRIPFCDAPIRDHDHVQRHTDDGPTSIDNGLGVCRRFNLVKEMPGWSTRVIHGHGPPGSHPHTVEITTPTGKTYRSTSPPVHSRAPDTPLSGIDIHLTARLGLAG